MPEPKPPPAKKPAASTVYPVEFVGYESKDANGKPYSVTEEEVHGFMWALHHPRDVVDAQRKKRVPLPHPTRRTRYFYLEADALRFKGKPGFVLHPPQEHRRGIDADLTLEAKTEA